MLDFMLIYKSLEREMKGQGSVCWKNMSRTVTICLKIYTTITAAKKQPIIKQNNYMEGPGSATIK